jgi:sugar transferase (PEP-CTERM/EpsH1 system associated)
MQRTIRILHVLHAFSAGGLENGVVNIINGSPEHFVHELCLLSKSGEFVHRLKKPVAVYEMNKKNGNSLRMILQLRQLFRSRTFDIIHTRNWAAFDGVMAACLAPRPVLIHGEHGRDVSDPDGKVYRRNLARRLLAFRARKFVAVSQDLYTWLRQTVRIPQSKLAFIPNGVDTDRFSPGRELELRKRLGIGETEFVVGTIGRLDPVKNHPGLIHAVRQLQKNGYPVRLVIVGDGPLHEDVAACVRSAQLVPDAIQLGYRSDVDRLYRLFDLFVLNSFAEGMSNTLLEAMACGLPIVCTAVGGNVELVADKVRGILIRAGDVSELTEALGQLICSRGERESFAASARNFTKQNFSISTMIDRYTELYESVATQRMVLPVFPNSGRSN